MWGVNTPKDAIKIINEQKFIGIPKNFEEQALQIVGRDIYERLIKGYTKKHWRIDPTELSVDIIKRLPVRFTFNNNYYFDKYQGIPENGYTELFEKMLIDVEVKLNTDLDNNWAVVAEAIQTVLRRENYPQPYEALKELTRGKNAIDKKAIHEFISKLKISAALKAELKNITPYNYTGI
jgi:hypothetical protein